MTAQSARKNSVLLPSQDAEHGAGIEEEGLSGLWAVSYCDLLMVLMSFFILFFQADDVQESVIQNLMLSLSKNKTITSKVSPEKVVEKPSVESVQTSPSATPQLGGVDTILAQSEFFKSAEELFGKDSVRVEKNYQGQVVVIDFEKNIYQSGKYEFPVSHKKNLIELLKLIKPHEKNLNITFIGHTDSSWLLKGTRPKVINSNLVLSDLRAVRALEIALGMGFDMHNLAAQGASSSSRNMRSLSIRIAEVRSR